MINKTNYLSRNKDDNCQHPYRFFQIFRQLDIGHTIRIENFLYEEGKISFFVMLPMNWWKNFEKPL